MLLVEHYAKHLQPLHIMIYIYIFITDTTLLKLSYNGIYQTNILQ